MEELTQKEAQEILQNNLVELFDDPSSPQEVVRRLGLWPVRSEFVVEEPGLAQLTNY